MNEMTPSVDPRQEPEDQSEIADASKLSLLELMESRDPVIVESLRRILAEVGQRPDVTTGWQSFLR